MSTELKGALLRSAPFCFMRTVFKIQVFGLFFFLVHFFPSLLFVVVLRTEHINHPRSTPVPPFLSTPSTHTVFFPFGDYHWFETLHLVCVMSLLY